MIKLIFLSFLWLAGLPSDEGLNVTQNIESLLCKEWKLRYREEEGRKEYPDEGEVNDRFIFAANHTVEIIEAGESQDGLWQYDPSTKRLVLTNRVSKDKLTMAIITLTNDELVLKFMDDTADHSTIYLVPVK